MAVVALNPRTGTSAAYRRNAAPDPTILIRPSGGGQAMVGASADRQSVRAIPQTAIIPVARPGSNPGSGTPAVRKPRFRDSRATAAARHSTTAPHTRFACHMQLTPVPRSLRQLVLDLLGRLVESIGEGLELFRPQIGGCEAQTLHPGQKLLIREQRFRRRVPGIHDLLA